MSESNFIRCLGCRTVVDATLAACAGCGRCLNCGRIRFPEETQCDDCNLPYCACCGRCPGCLKLRYATATPCDCGHPTDAAQLSDLISRNAVSNAESSSSSMAWILIPVVFAGLIILGIVAVLAGLF